MKVLILKESDIKEVFSMTDAIQADKDALESYSRGESRTPLRTNLNIPEEEGQSLYMPGYVSSSKALGVKVVGTYPNNIERGLNSVPATMILQNSETGEVCCIMDGTYLTEIRTGALSGAATDILSRKDCKIFTLFGTGGQAESQIRSVLNVRDIEEIRIIGSNKEKTKNFVAQMGEVFKDISSAKFVVAEDADSAIKDADIITAVTSAKKPVFNGKLVKKGVHINGVGSYTPEMQEIDDYILTNADKVYVDTRDGVLNESGDFITPMKEGKFLELDLTGELGEVIMGNAPSRENDDEITFFKTVGSAVLDVVTARRIYEKAIEKGIGEFIEI